MSETQKTYRVIKLLEVCNKTVAKKTNFDLNSAFSSLVHFHLTELCTKRKFLNSDLLTFNKLVTFFPKSANFFFRKKDLQSIEFYFLKKFGGYILYNYFQEGLQKNSFHVYENIANLELDPALTSGFLKKIISIPTFLDKQTCFWSQTGLFQTKLLIRLYSYNFSEKSMIKIKKSIQKSPVYYLDSSELKFKYLNKDFLKGSWALIEAFCLEASWEYTKKGGDFPYYDESTETYRNIYFSPKEIIYKGFSLKVPDIFQIECTIPITYINKKKAFRVTTKDLGYKVYKNSILRKLYGDSIAGRTVYQGFFINKRALRGLVKRKWLSEKSKEKNYKLTKNRRKYNYNPFGKYSKLNSKTFNHGPINEYYRPWDYEVDLVPSEAFRKNSIFFSAKKGRLSKPSMLYYYRDTLDTFLLGNYFLVKDIISTNKQALLFKMKSIFLITNSCKTVFKNINSFIKLVSSTELRKYFFSKVITYNASFAFHKNYINIPLNIINNSETFNLDEKLYYMLPSNLKVLKGAHKYERLQRVWIPLNKRLAEKKTLNRKVKALYEIHVERTWKETIYTEPENLRVFKKVIGMSSKFFNAKSDFAWKQNSLVYNKSKSLLQTILERNTFVNSEVKKTHLMSKKLSDNIYDLIEMEKVEANRSFYGKGTLKSPETFFSKKMFPISGENQFASLQCYPSNSKTSLKTHPLWSGEAISIKDLFYNKILNEVSSCNRRNNNLLKFSLSSVFNVSPVVFFESANRLHTKTAEEYFSIEDVKSIKTINYSYMGSESFFSSVQTTPSCFTFKQKPNRLDMCFDLFLTCFSQNHFKQHKKVLTVPTSRFKDFFLKSRRPSTLRQGRWVMFTPLATSVPDYLSFSLPENIKYLQPSWREDMGMITHKQWRYKNKRFWKSDWIDILEKMKEGYSLIEKVKKDLGYR